MADLAPQHWQHYQLESGQVIQVVRVTDHSVWVLRPEDGDQWTEDLDEFVDGLETGTIQRVEPTYEPVETSRTTRTRGVGA